MSETTTPRDLRPEDAEAMRDCLIWLGNGQFIEESTMDVYDDTVFAFGKARGKMPTIEEGRKIMAFLAWMDYGDRLRTIGPDNPYGTNIEFYSGDYGFGEAAARQCAEDMVQAYKDGE